jgi:hypothetical protein
MEVEYIKGCDNASDCLSRRDDYVYSIEKMERIQPKDIQKILNFYHLTLGHGSPGNMKYNILRKYAWKGANRQINKFLQNCEVCQKDKKRSKYTDCNPIGANKPYQIWEADLIGTIPTSENGNNYILTVIDHYTKLAHAIAIKNKDMFTIREILEEKLFKKYEGVEYMLTDNGKEFRNGLMYEISKKYGVIWKFGSPYTPTTTGLVERFNQIIMNKIKKLSNFGETDWESVLNDSLNAYLHSYHRAIGCSPHEIVNGEMFLKLI